MATNHQMNLSVVHLYKMVRIKPIYKLNKIKYLCNQERGMIVTSRTLLGKNGSRKTLNGIGLLLHYGRKELNHNASTKTWTQINSYTIRNPRAIMEYSLGNIW